MLSFGADNARLSSLRCEVGAFVPAASALRLLSLLYFLGPGMMAQGAAFMPLYTLLWLLPVLIYDIARRERVHRAYVIGLALNLPFVIVSHSLWGSPWWFEVAPKLMGADGG